jgi:hypothetical protein
MQLTFVLAMLRHLLTFAGGALAARGIVDSGTVEVVSGAVLTIVGAVWSVVEKKQRIE